MAAILELGVCSFGFQNMVVRLDYQPLFGKGARGG